MKNRIELAKYFGTLGFKMGAEIGVCDGYYSEILCKNIPELKLYCIDPWEFYRDYRDFARKQDYQQIYNSAIQRLEPYNCEIIKKFSMDAVKDFEDGSLDFVYIDANHSYEFVKEDIKGWTEKVRHGGIVSGHDYYVTRAGNTGVICAVDEYVKEHGVQLLKTNHDARCQHKDDRQTNWYFTNLKKK